MKSHFAPLFLPVLLFFAHSTLEARIIHVPADSATIQAGINGAADGDTVLVADGVYNGEGSRDIDFLGKAILVMSEHGPEATVVDCETDTGDPHRGFYFHSGETNASVLRGFTIRNGNVSVGSEDPYGGGIFCAQAAPTISQCIISGNTAHTGGGIYCWEFNDPVIIRNCLFIGNAAEWGGALFGGSATVTNCTFTGNIASVGNGAIHLDHFSVVTVINSILWGDEPEEIRPGIGSANISYSDVQGGWGGENIDADPLFRIPGEGDYRLMATECGDSLDSPCIDAGHPDSIDVLLDCSQGLGTERADMGAFGGRNAGWAVGIEDSHPESGALPSAFSLAQNYPNPFNPATTIAFEIARTRDAKEHVRLSIHDARGRFILALLDTELAPGTHRVIWNGRNARGEPAPSGVYFARITSGDSHLTRKMVLFR